MLDVLVPLVGAILFTLGFYVLLPWLLAQPVIWLIDWLKESRSKAARKKSVAAAADHAPSTASGGPAKPFNLPPWPPTDD